MAVIAKIKLAPLVPNWRDLDNEIFIRNDKEIVSIEDDMNLSKILEAVKKGFIVITEGEIPENDKTTGGSCNCNGITRLQMDTAISDAISKIKHPVTESDIQDILERVEQLEEEITNPIVPPVVDEPENELPYEWKEVYIMTSSHNQIIIDGSKLITDCEEDGQTFWDNFDLGKYKLYAPRLVSKSGIPTTEADDLEDTLIPITGYGEEQGTDLVNVSPSLDGITWSWDEGQNYIELSSTPTTLIVFYLIKDK